MSYQNPNRTRQSPKQERVVVDDHVISLFNIGLSNVNLFISRNIVTNIMNKNDLSLKNLKEKFIKKHQMPDNYFVCNTDINAH